MSEKTSYHFYKVEIPNKIESVSRCIRPVLIYEQKTKETFQLQQSEVQEVKGKKYKFIAPNNITLCLSISNREYSKASELFKNNIIHKTKMPGNSISFEYEETESLFDYFEHLQVSIIFAYTAVETFINFSIPSDFKYEKQNNKKVKEIWDKESIERYITTNEKLQKILPIILKVKPPTQETFWKNFLKLEEVRHEIIHQKSISNNPNLSSTYLKYFLDIDIFEVIRSAALLINFYCEQSEIVGKFFPMGMGNRQINPIIVDDMNSIGSPIYEGEDTDF